MSDGRGYVELIAAVIIIALSVASSPILLKITEDVSKNVLSSTSSASAYVSVTDGKVRMVNPSPVPVELKRVKLIVNGQQVSIADDDGDGVWEPYEGATFDSSVLNRDVVVISVLIDDNEVYRAVYTSPKAFTGDSEYPVINLDVNASSLLSLNVSVSDDTAVASLRVVKGVMSGGDVVETDVHLTNVLEKVANRHGMPLDRLLVDLEENALSSSVSSDLRNYRETVSIQDSLNDLLYLKVVSKDVSGKTSTRIVYYRDLLPSVAILQPGNGDVLWTTTASSTVNIQAVASGASRVKLYVDGAEVVNTTATSSPFSFGDLATLVTGNHTVTAVAENIVGSATDTVSFTVARDYPPSITITQPANGQTIQASNGSATVTIAASVKDDRGTPVVDFYVDGALIGSDSTPPYRIVANLSTGSHTIRVVATDIMNQTDFDEVTVSVGEDLPPQVSIMLPVEGIRLPDNNPVMLIATANDDLGLNSVLIYVDGVIARSAGVSGKNASVIERFNLSVGNHSFTVVAEDTTGHRASDTVNFTVYSARPPQIKIIRPFNGQTFVPGDPWFGVVSWDDEWHSNTVDLNSNSLRVLDLATLAGNTYSIGPIYAVGNATLSIPNPGISGKGVVEVKISPASSYGAATAFRPKVLKGIADSKGVNISLDIPTDAIVRVRLQPIAGLAPVQNIKKVDGWWCTPVKAELDSVFSAQEGAQAAKLVVPISLSYYERDHRGYEFFYYTVSVENVGKLLSGKVTLAEGQYYQYIFKTTNSKKLYLTTTDSRINYLLAGKTLVISVTGGSWGCYAGARFIVYFGTPVLQYYTKSTNPRLIVDGVAKVSAKKLDLDTRSVGGSFTIGAGKHVLKLVSDYGAFEYEVVIYPAIRNPSKIVVQAPWGSSFTLTPGQSFKYSGSLDNLFGRFNFTTPDGGVYLVEVRYVFKEVNVP